jgi:hypothetical protein
MLYRFCFFDAEEHAAATEELEVRSLIDAMARAHMLLKARPQHETIEVWLGQGHYTAQHTKGDRSVRAPHSNAARV